MSRGETMGDNSNGNKGRDNTGTSSGLRRTVGRVVKRRNTEPVPILDLAHLARPQLNPSAQPVVVVVNTEALHMQELMTRLAARPLRRVAHKRVATLPRPAGRADR